MKAAFRDKIGVVHQLSLTADQLISALLTLSENDSVCILDSCGVGHLGSHLLIAGIEPVEVIELSDDDPDSILATLDNALSGDLASVFTLSYGLGEKLNRVSKPQPSSNSGTEPDVFLASFDVLIIHDYDSGTSQLTGNKEKFAAIERKLLGSVRDLRSLEIAASVPVTSNFNKAGYLNAIETIKERIRCGDTYQTNLTQQLSVRLAAGSSSATIFDRLRRDHPAPFAAYLKRKHSTVISASPERFFRVSSPQAGHGSARRIETSPIKGTRPRGSTDSEDAALRTELLASKKDRAENTMIVDLLRNDLGRVCEYGSVRVEKLCDLEEHPTLFHLVSTVSGDLRPETRFSDIIRALFPCGSITGAPKISTMGIINEIETADRGLSMGAIGYHIPNRGFGMPAVTDLSVAIRTIVVRDNIATFNVGGGIVIDSDPEKEYDESLLKAQALLAALGAEPTDLL